MSPTVRLNSPERRSRATVASVTAAVLGFPVVDETQLTGLWTVELRYEPDVASVQQLGSRFTAPRIGDALKEQLGLKLESAPGPVKVIVIDSVRQPTEN